MFVSAEREREIQRIFVNRPFIETVFEAANPVRSVSDIHSPLTVGPKATLNTLVHSHSVFEARTAIDEIVRHPENMLPHHDEIDDVAAGLLVVGKVHDALLEGKTVVVEDSTHGEVLGIRSAGEGIFEVLQRSRFDTEPNVQRVIERPKIEVRFFQGENGKEISITIFGAELTKMRRKKIAVVSSDGQTGKHSFLVIASMLRNVEGKLQKEEEVITALQDPKGSLHGIYHHLPGVSRWLVSGKDKAGTIRRQRARNRQPQSI